MHSRKIYISLQGCLQQIFAIRTCQKSQVLELRSHDDAQIPSLRGIICFSLHCSAWVPVLASFCEATSCVHVAEGAALTAEALVL